MAAKLATAPQAAQKTALGAPVEKAQALLDEKVKKVHELRYAVNVSMWALGGALNEIHLTRVWEARGKYTSFNGFCAAEIKMSGASVHRLIGLHRRFNEEQMRVHGPSRLFEVMAAPEAQWPALLSLCEQGATCRDLRDRVRAIRMSERRKPGSTVIVRRHEPKGNTTAATVAAAKRRESLRAEGPIPAPRRVSPQEWSVVLTARRSPGEKVAKPACSLAQQPSGSLTIPGVGTITLSLFEGERGAICVDAKLTPAGAS